MKSITFWNLLSDTEGEGVEIPIIQRDYAQGRSGKEELRKSFLRDLHTALDKRKQMKLDFVYGTKENGRLNPLDGQQRLTTLWLLHWYLAFRAEELKDEVVGRLKRFTYETRLSSRQFCERLAEFSALPPANEDLANHIRNQSWFRRAWRNDPTIQSMLRMISGTLGDKSDGIEGVFKCPEECKEYWSDLISSDCPIVFSKLDLPDIVQSDDLYIKMNARGKPLTSFENLKADLAGYVKNLGNEGLNDPKTGLPIMMDTTWMNIFWGNKSSDNAVDEIYFAFLTRYFFNAWVLKSGKAGDLKKADDPIFDFLYGRNSSSDGENEKIAYLGFDVYKNVLESDNTLLSRLYKTMNNFVSLCEDSGYKANTYFEAPWNDGKDSKFNFLPCYTEKEPVIDFAGNRIRAIDRITQPRRVVFHAICRFFEEGWAKNDNDVQALKDWMRVVWNIVENANIDTISGMIGCLKLIDELAKWSHNILEKMSSEDSFLKSDFARNQMNEEIAKARKIMEDRNKWEGLIREAEVHGVFRGAIRCLYRGAEKDWDNFSTRWENAKGYFNSLDDNRMYHYLRWLVANCTTSNDLREIIYDICPDTWKTNLLNDGLKETVDKFLMTPAPDVIKLGEGLENEEQYKRAKVDLCSPGFFEGLSYNGNHVNGCELRETYGQLLLTPSNAKSPKKKYVIANKRNALLAKLGSTGQKLPECDYYWGLDINFEYNGHKFQWDRYDTVYLMDENYQYVKGTEGGHSRFAAKEIDNSEQLTKKLDELLEMQ